MRKFESRSAYFLLLSITAVGLCVAVNRLWSSAAWGAVAYGGDAHQVMALVKAFASGDATPFGEKIIEHLNAPFGANWYDFPFEDMIWIVPGFFARWMDVPHALVLYFVVICWAAAISFSYAGIALGYHRVWVFAFSLLFAFSPYLFARSFAHMNLTVYWHIPLLLYTIRRLAEGTGVHTARQTATLCSFAILAGLLSVYYLYPFLFIGGFVLIGHIVDRRWQPANKTALVLAVAIGAFLFQHLDTLYFTVREGGNPGAIVRNLDGLARYGLRLDDLVYPYAHRLPAMRDLANQHIGKVVSEFRGEGQSAYMGLFPLFALAALLMRGFANIMTARVGREAIWFGSATLVLLLGVVGGVNYLLGNFGLIYFRATNRFSIILSAIALLFLCQWLSQWPIKRRHAAALAAVIVVLGLLDQVPANNRSPGWVRNTSLIIDGDRRFASELERALPSGAMVFQLPVVAYPEAGKSAQMLDYAQFRPYLFTDTIKYSYGTIKGRGEAEWQKLVEGLPAESMVHRLEQFGFAAILIDGDGYQDGGATLINSLKTLGLSTIATRGSWIAFRLNPSDRPILPPITKLRLVLRSGFYQTETSGAKTWNWAKDRASLVVARNYRATSSRTTALNSSFKFGVQGFGRGNVWMSVSGAPFEKILDRSQVNATVSVLLAEGRKSEITFKSDIVGKSPGGNDPRALSFRIISPTLD